MSKPAAEMRILVADSHELVRRGIRAVLEERHEWRVCGEAATAASALEKAKKLRPDLLLLDVTLPDRDAAEVIPEIMQVCPAVKIVALATQDSSEQAARALAAGAIGLVLKSDSANDLVMALQNIGKNQPFLSPGAVRALQSQLAKNKISGAMPTDLTPRELEVLKLLASGQSHKQVAGSLKIRVKTVDAHRANIMRKLKLVTYSELIQFALRHKLIET
jgi:DNA-binding NarL/FixJ family response regulator